MIATKQIPSQRVAVARYLLAADKHFRLAALYVGTTKYEVHLHAAMAAQRAATAELVGDR